MTVPRTPLPVDEVVADVVRALDGSGQALLIAPPGSGKTTRVPPALARSTGLVVVLEPRRLAARAAARRVAVEWGCPLGAAVGYQVRDDRERSDGTRVLFVTEGVLVRWLLGDPFLDGVHTVVLDEFHERNLEGDLALAMVQELRAVRDDLRLLVMSATLDTAPLDAFLGGPVHVSAEGQSFGVETVHLEAGGRRLDERVRQAVGRGLEESAGDILVFLPGVGEIERCAAALTGLARERDLLVLPLHGRLPRADQDRAMEPQERRKVVLATNVAESSVTVPGVTAVVDSGLCRVLRRDPGRGIDALELQSIPRASADQRRGRAGRTAPGHCYRLWSRVEERRMPAHGTPEIHRVDLSFASLAVAAFAGRDPRRFSWFEPPAPEALERALALLRALGAVDSRGCPTPLGRDLLALPLPPRLGRVVLEGRRRGCPRAAAWAAALLAELEGDPEVTDLEQLVENGTRGLPPAVAQRVARTARRLGRQQRRDPHPEALAAAVLAGFPDRVVRRHQPGAREGVMVGGRGVLLPPDLAPDAALVIALRLIDVGRGDRSRVGLAVPVMMEDLEALAGAVRRETAVELDEQAGRVRAVTRTLFFDLVLAEHVGGRPDPERVEALVAPLLARDPWRWLGAVEPLRAFLARVAWLRRRQPALDLPDITDADVARAAARALGTGNDLRALFEVNLVPHLSGLLPPGALRQLERLAPARVALPSGRSVRVDYAREAGPTVRARIQELFGAVLGPRVLAGRESVVLEILAPNQRPVQVTADLPGFWERTYPELRRELARRYPRHPWPVDPAAEHRGR